MGVFVGRVKNPPELFDVFVPWEGRVTAGDLLVFVGHEASPRGFEFRFESGMGGGDYCVFFVARCSVIVESWLPFIRK